MEGREISKAVITRLPRYYRYLGELMELGVERISSNELSSRMKVTASQIRQDLNNFGGFGQQGYGYNVKYLYNEIGKILGIDRKHNLIIIGAGNLGQAIANYANFEKRGFIIKGMFDINPRLIGLVVRGIEIRGVDDLEQFIFLYFHPHILRAFPFCRSFGRRASSLNAFTVVDSNVCHTRNHIDFTIGTTEVRDVVTSGSPHRPRHAGALLLRPDAVL